MPGDSFWEGVAKAFYNATPDLLVAFAVICVITFFILKYYIPARKEDRENVRELEMKKFELEQQMKKDELDVARSRIEVQARQVEVSNGIKEILSTVSAQMQSLITSNEVIKSQMNDSKVNSKAIGKVIELMQDDVSYLRDKVDDIHDVMFERVGGTK